MNNGMTQDDFNRLHDETRHKMVQEISLPPWADRLPPCSECQHPLTHDDVYEVSLKLNAQHIGDVAVSTMCPACFSGVVLHFRQQCRSVDDFVDFLRNGSEKTPVPAHKIAVSENNVTDEALFGEEGETQP